MKILFIADTFFGYAAEIKLALERKGHEVLWYRDRHTTSAFGKFMIRTAPRLVRGQADRYLEAIVASSTDIGIDEVFMIKGEGFSPRMIKRLREALPQARFTLYFWDSYRNMPADSAAKVQHFDRAFTFDPVDAENDRRLRYRELFFLDGYGLPKSAEQDIDVLFFGTVHSDRFAVLSRLVNAIPPSVNVRRVMYVASKWIYTVRSVIDPAFWPSRKSDFIFEPLKKPQVMALYARARVVIDIERAVQTGCTMRTIEMVGASKKLITTNQHIKQADFYRPENICVVDRHRPVIDPAFFHQAYVPLPEDMLARYSLSGWLEEVLPENRESVGNVDSRAMPSTGPFFTGQRLQAMQ